MKAILIVLAGIIGVAGLAAGLQLPELRRYLKIRAM
jgi:hypothetical protein